MMMAGRAVTRGAASSAWPTIVSQTASEITTAASSISMTLPSGIEADDFLLCFLVTSAGYTRTPSAGWNTLAILNASYAHGNIFWKVATGSDALTVSFSGSMRARGTVIRIVGANICDVTDANQLYSANMDAPAHTPAISGKNYLYYTGGICANIAPMSAAPSGYSGLTNQTPPDGNDGTLFFSYKNGLTSAEDPGAWTGGSSYNAVFTMAVYNTGG